FPAGGRCELGAHQKMDQGISLLVLIRLAVIQRDSVPTGTPGIVGTLEACPEWLGQRLGTLFFLTQHPPLVGNKRLAALRSRRIAFDFDRFLPANIVTDNVLQQFVSFVCQASAPSRFHTAEPCSTFGL